MIWLTKKRGEDVRVLPLFAKKGEAAAATYGKSVGQ